MLALMFCRLYPPQSGGPENPHRRGSVREPDPRSCPPLVRRVGAAVPELPFLEGGLSSETGLIQVEAEGLRRPHHEAPSGSDRGCAP